MGTNGLEPSTSRLSGVRSNHLSYAPNTFLVEMRRIELLTPCLQSRCSPSWATPPLPYFFFFQSSVFFPVSSKLNKNYFLKPLLTGELFYEKFVSSSLFSIERRWSSRTFRYGYLVTTSPQSSIPPSTASSLKVRLQASGVTDSHGVTGGVYKARERIHRSMLICDY